MSAERYGSAGKPQQVVRDRVSADRGGSGEYASIAEKWECCACNVVKRGCSRGAVAAGMYRACLSINRLCRGST
jgi:hypothetical protein